MKTIIKKKRAKHRKYYGKKFNHEKNQGDISSSRLLDICQKHSSKKVEQSDFTKKRLNLKFRLPTGSILIINIGKDGNEKFDESSINKFEQDVENFSMENFFNEIRNFFQLEFTFT